MDAHGESSLHKLTIDAGFDAVSNGALPSSLLKQARAGWPRPWTKSRAYICVGDVSDISAGALVGVDENGKLFDMPMQVALPRAVAVACKKRARDRRRAAHVSIPVGGGFVGGGGGTAAMLSQVTVAAVGPATEGASLILPAEAGPEALVREATEDALRILHSAGGGGVGGVGTGMGSDGRRVADSAGGGGARGVGAGRRVADSAGSGGARGVGTGSDGRCVADSSGGGGARGVGAGSDGRRVEAGLEVLVRTGSDGRRVADSAGGGGGGARGVGTGRRVADSAVGAGGGGARDVGTGSDGRRIADSAGGGGATEALERDVAEDAPLILPAGAGPEACWYGYGKMRR